ncbi:MAG: alpha/beta hydrolase [Tabrizicola sp.]|jgi:pimeloyl-ACP methyl ester carboxylesterase|nr:alpha/beta hydrolase [Tabrizicola sp.]
MRHILFALACLAAPAQAQSLYEATSDLATFPCEASSLTCTKLTLPLDHRANDPDKTIDISFAMSFATYESRGILFFFVGGPGASGLASAENYLSSFDEGLIQYMDIVFVDQRGTGPDHGLSCPLAQARFEAAEVSIDQPDTAMQVARTYVTECTTEMGRDDILPFVNSDQAIRDSEAFRQKIGSPKVWMYGESYGTQFVQAYAAQFPQAVRGVILDGVVDLNLDAPGFYAASTRASESILGRIFAECGRNPDCARDMGEDAGLVYDRLMAGLQKQPLTVPFITATGSTQPRPLTAGMLEATAFYALYSPEGRSEFLRALAASARGNHLPLLQLAYSYMYIDPETLVGLDDPSWFSAAFYAITCTDYDSGTGTPDDRAAAILAEAAAFAPEAPRLLRAHYFERIACAYWPYQGPSARPAQYAGGDWPTLILNSDSDPITPITMAYSVFDNSRNAHAVFLKGGPHVIWGRGIGCPDEIVYDLLLDGVAPAEREYHCEQDLLGEYTPLTLTDPAEMADPVAVAQAVDTELYQIIPLITWDGLNPLTIGCDFGGTLTAEPTDYGTDYQFADCRLWSDLAVSGSGQEINVDEPGDNITLSLSVSGPQSGDILYRLNLRDESWSLSGTWNGKPAALPRLRP